MPTRIKGTDSSPVSGGSSRGVERVQRSASVANATKPTAGAVESVHITSSARQLLALQQAIRDIPDVDAGRVDALRQAIEQNQYTVDAGKIADRLLQLEGDLRAVEPKKPEK